MGHCSVKIDPRNERNGMLLPRKREGTKNFMDVPLELRKKDFETVAGRHFVKILPPDIRDHFRRAILETGIESEDALRWLEYALATDDNGRLNSPIARWTYEAPYNPRAFKYLYGIEDALSQMDRGYILTSGAHAIYLRLQSLIEKLPGVIKSERQKLGLKEGEYYVIFNIGAS